VTLNKREQALTHGLNYAALIFGFLIVAGAMVMSYFLIVNSHVIVGSIFGGVALMYFAYLFISVINKNATPPNKG